MGNCLVRPGVSCEEAKPLVSSTVHDQTVFSGDNCRKKRKKVRFNVDNAVEAATETTIMRPPARMKKGVRVKVVLTQSELKQILNRATIYHHPPPPSESVIDQISGQVMVKCMRSRRSSVMCKCRCSWNPALHTIPEWDHY